MPQLSSTAFPTPRKSLPKEQEGVCTGRKAGRNAALYLGNRRWGEISSWPWVWGVREPPFPLARTAWALNTSYSGWMFGERKNSMFTEDRSDVWAFPEGTAVFNITAVLFLVIKWQVLLSVGCKESGTLSTHYFGCCILCLTLHWPHSQYDQSTMKKKF